MPVAIDTHAPSMIATALAHEIKNPAALAMAYAGIIRQISNHDEVAEYCNLIQNSLMDISDLVQELLFSIHSSPQPCTVNIADMLVEMLGEYQMAMPCVTFSFEAHPQLVCYASEQYLRLVLSNLLKNAAEAAENLGGGYVKVYARISQGNLQVDICNNINFVGHMENKRHSNGMGMGICHWLLQQLGGKMRFENNSNMRTTTVSLPCNL